MSCGLMFCFVQCVAGVSSCVDVLMAMCMVVQGEGSNEEDSDESDEYAPSSDESEDGVWTHYIAWHDIYITFMHPLPLVLMIDSCCILVMCGSVIR